MARISRAEFGAVRFMAAPVLAIALALGAPAFAALAQTAATTPAAPSQNFEPTDETPEVLPAGAGRDEAFYLCTGCHGTAIVTAQGMRRDQWDETLNVMVEKHRMPVPETATRDLVLDYLAATFPARPAQQRGWVNPFLNRQSP